MNFVELNLDDGFNAEDLFEYVSDFTDELVLVDPGQSLADFPPPTRIDFGVYRDGELEDRLYVKLVALRDEEFETGGDIHEAREAAMKNLVEKMYAALAGRYPELTQDDDEDYDFHLTNDNAAPDMKM